MKIKWENLNPHRAMTHAGIQWEMLSEEYLMWIECDGERYLEKLACLDSTPPVARGYESDWADNAADYVSKERHTALIAMEQEARPT